jgi:pentatricopeptide repeat domain-containing protein 1
VQEAIRILSEMTNNGIQPCPITFNTFLSCYAGKGLFAEANEVIRYMIEHGCMPNELTYKIVIDGYIREKKHKEAMDFVSKIKEIDISFDDQSLKKLASCIRKSLGT